MKKAEVILRHLKQANTSMTVIKINAELMTKTIPADLSNEIRLELDNLRESLYIVDRDITAWMEIAQTPTSSAIDENFNAMDCR